MNFKDVIDKDRKYFKQDFSAINDLLKKIRQCLIKGENLSCSDIEKDDAIKYVKNESMIFITLFQAGQKSIRFGSRIKIDIENSLNMAIKSLRTKKNFSNFNIADENMCRILLEYSYDIKKTDVKNLQTTKFDENRFEPGITGIELKNKKSYFYMPTDAITNSQMTLNQALNKVLRQTPIAKETNKISERIKILQNSQDYECFLFKSRAFITYKDRCIPLYRGNVIYDKYDKEILSAQVIASADWNLKNMQNDGKFLYYYDCCNDNYIDHEHPERKPDDLYYNDLRHCGGIISFLRAYQLTKDNKYIEGAKKALNWSTTISKEHDTQWGKGYYAYYNKKAKLGGVGVLLCAMMLYRIITKDKSFDNYIKGYVRHLISRVYKNGEMLGYYIHPSYQNANPLVEMNDKERKETFSFYYPGEALFGLALFVNNFENEDDLKQIVKVKAKQALDWLVDERPTLYKDLFTALPSDGWLMQAIEEWSKDKDIINAKYINYVFNDADIMCEKIYKKYDSPYMDYEGGMYYNHGDHYYPDGARCEGLIAAYYLANAVGLKNYAKKYLQSCKQAAVCIFHLFNSQENSYSHKNPEKSVGSIRFKATRQWVRVDSIQHVSCFFARLYMAENNLT